MSDITRIFNSDINLPLRYSQKKALDSKRDIDGELAKWGIKKTMWEWDLDNRKVECVFELPADKFHEMPVGVRLKPPTIWKKAGRYKDPVIDWNMSIRLLYWYIKFQLAWVYASQSSPIVAFLPHVQAKGDATVKDVILPRLSLLKSLPDQPLERKVVDAEVVVEDV